MPKKNARETLSTMDRAELDEARVTLARGEAVRIVVGKVIALCSTLEEVRAAQRGIIPNKATRLDGTTHT